MYLFLYIYKRWRVGTMPPFIQVPPTSCPYCYKYCVSLCPSPCPQSPYSLPFHYLLSSVDALCPVQEHIQLPFAHHSTPKALQLLLQGTLWGGPTNLHSPCGSIFLDLTSTLEMHCIRTAYSTNDLCRAIQTAQLQILNIYLFFHLATCICWILSV